jgi:hypothetical protein
MSQEPLDRGIKPRSTARERILQLVRRFQGADHTIRLAPDYGASLPLWPGQKAGEPEEFLPRELLGRLSEWQRYWEIHHDYSSGWDSEEAQSRWQSDGAILVSDVRAAVPAGLKLKVDF